MGFRATLNPVEIHIHPSIGINDGLQVSQGIFYKSFGSQEGVIPPTTSCLEIHWGCWIK